MQAIERISFSNDWLTLVLLGLFFMLSFMNLLDKKKFNKVLFTFFNVSYLEDETDENYSFFEVFQMLFFVFSITVIALLVFEFKNFYSGNLSYHFQDFIQVFFLVFAYFSVKKMVEYFLLFVFQLKRKLSFFIQSKNDYLFTVSIFLYLIILLKTYVNLEAVFCYYLAGFLFIIGFIFHFIKNKNLLINHFFYFILYICTLKIAPLLILIKLMI